MSEDSLTVKPLALQDDGGSNPTSSLQFFRCDLKNVSDFIKKHHYSHTHPGGIDFSFGLTYNDILAGACVFGYMAGNPKYAIIKGVDPHKFRELMRLVLLDEVPKNSESKFIAWCLRYLKKNTDLEAIVSFADPKFNHTGTVYKASNWFYAGKQKPDRPRLIINGEEVHPRSSVNRFGTSSIPKLRNMGLTVETQVREPKHKYIYYLRNRPAPKEKDWLEEL